MAKHVGMHRKLWINLLKAKDVNVPCRIPISSVKTLIISGIKYKSGGRADACKKAALFHAGLWHTGIRAVTEGLT
jgi:hypothetical protein